MYQLSVKGCGACGLPKQGAVTTNLGQGTES